ncbi:hypothetical protein MACJ_001275 [Theileria orientalis]|uniref:Uncharacterized protein n=1 Tax=Theileria orientalis TaxID=68886 RepID=A0A976M9T4_THEOR|nr:hypothetical protein MACJ_001275 [Theileria orientalis]
MHLVRKDYIFFYNDGVVCYKATPVSSKKVVKRDLNYKNERINISPTIDEHKTSYINEPQISLVPPKPLNLFESLQKEKEEIPKEINEDTGPKIRPCIALNTLYSLVYPFTETGNTYVFPKKEESGVKRENKHDDINTSNKTARGLYKFPRDANCNKCTPLDRFDKEDYIYTCPETISPHRTTDLLINKYVLRKKRFIDDHYDMGQQYTSNSEVEREIPLSYKVVREKTFSDDTVERKLSDDKESILDDYELTGYEDELVKPEPEPKSDNGDIVIKTRLDTIRSENNPTIISIIKSVEYDHLLIDRLFNYQKPGIARILSNEEISEVIESPNVISSPESFSRQLSKLPSVKTVSIDSKTFEKEVTPQHSTSSFDDPLEQKLSEIFNVPLVKSEDSTSPLDTDQTQPLSSDDQSDAGSEAKVPFYPIPIGIKPIQIRKKPPEPLISDRELLSSPGVSSEEITGGSIRASNDSPIESVLECTIESDENLTTPIVSSEITEITDYETSEPTSQDHDVLDTKEEDELVEQEEEYERKESEPHESVEAPIEIEPVERTDEVNPFEKPIDEEQVEDPMEIEQIEPDKEVKPVEEDDIETIIAPKEPGEVYINAKNKEVIRPLKNNKNNVLIRGFEATVFAVNANKSATSALCTILFNYDNDLLIIKSETDIFEIKATDLTSEEIPTSPGSPILLKISLNNRPSSAIVLQTYARRNLEILAGTIGWVKNRDKEEFGDKAPRMNVRRSLFGGLKGKKRKDRASNGNGGNDNNGQGTSTAEETWLSKEEEKGISKKLFNRIKRRQKARDAAKYF